MFISRLVIHNYRNFKQLDVPLTRQSVIVGANRVGKSNLINAVRLAIDPNLTPEARKLNRDDFCDGSGQPFDGRKIIVVVEFKLETEDERNAMMNLKALVPDHRSNESPASEVEINEQTSVATASGSSSANHGINTFGTARFTYEFFRGNSQIDQLITVNEADTTPEETSNETLADDNNTVESHTVSYHPSEYTYIWYAGLWFDAKLRDKNDREVNPRKLNSRVIMLTLHALRDTEDLLSRWGRSPLRSLLEGLNLDREFLENIANLISSEAGKIALNTQVSELMREIDNRSSEMIGAIFNIGPTLNAISNDAEDLLRALQLFVDRDSPRPRPVSRASLGTLNILYLALLLEDMYRNKLNNQQQTILALEEPEAHVHPHVQRSLFKYFVASAEKEKSTVLIVTTHSPQIVSVSPLSSLIVLRDHPTNGTQPSWVNTDYFTDAEILDIQRYLDVTRGELIFAKSIIFVEGITEKFLLPVFAELIGIDLDHLGISVVSVEGVDFEPYIKLVSPRNLNIPFVVLTDRDMQNSGKEPGLSRARRIINWLDPNITDQLDLEELARKGMFLGEYSTFEVELLVLCHDQMCEAYDGLVSRQSTRDKFRTAMNLARTEIASGIQGKGIGEVLRRIEKQGKGAYAQRLSSILQKTDNPLLCPAYVQKCIFYAEALSLAAAGRASVVQWSI